MFAPVSLGEAVRVLRRRSGYSRDQLALEAGVSTGAISNYENGVSVPGAPTLRQIARALSTALGHDVAHVWEELGQLLDEGRERKASDPKAQLERWVGIVSPMETLSRSEDAVTARARVLVVDDEEDLRVLFAEILGHEFDCATASNGDEALRLLRADEFDALVLDLSMPDVDGWAVLGALRADDDLQAPPTVVLSAHFDEDTETRARALGAVAYVAKPVPEDDLVNAVAHAVDGRASA